MTCREAIREVFLREPGVLTTAGVVACIGTRHPSRPWKLSTIRTMLIALSVNHSSAHHYPAFRKHAFLFSLGGGRFRLWDASKDAGATTVGGPGREPAAVRRGRAHAVATAESHVAGSATPSEASSAPHRSELVRRLVEEIQGESFRPQYRRQPFGVPVDGWPARLRSYFWPNPTLGWCATAETLEPWFEEAGVLSRRLLDGAAWGVEERRRAGVLAWLMLTWGGVTRQEAFSESTVEAVFRRALALTDGEVAPMNSGWTKVAALATAFFEGDATRAPHVIWDSRVSTSIVWRLDGMLAGALGGDPKRLLPGLGAVVGRGGTRPRDLKNRWARPYGRWWGQEAGSAVVREMRDVLNDGQYGWMPLPAGGAGPWTIRGVESVLFMDGY